MSQKRFKIAIGDWTLHKAEIYDRILADSFYGIVQWIYMQPPTKTKHALYFLRGDACYRSNAGMRDIQFLVVDGDCSLSHPERAPGPKKVHKILKGLNLNHFIYPSWSNGQKLPGGGRKRKWRLLVPCVGVNNKEALRAHTALLHRIIQDGGADIGPVVESYVTSQAWYLSKPKKSNWHTEKFYYLHDDGDDWDAGNLKTKAEFGVYYKSKRGYYPKTVNGRRGVGSRISIKQAFKNIRSGHQLHPSLVVIAKKLYRVRGDLFFKEELIELASGTRSPARLENIGEEIDGIIEWIRIR